MNRNSADIIGMESGTTILKKTVISVPPSIIADSSKEDSNDV